VTDFPISLSFRRHGLSALLAAALLGCGPTALHCQEPKPAPAAPPAKPTAAELQAAFDKAEAARAATAANTKERSDAAKMAMHHASDVAWTAFDAAQFDEAAKWFERSATLAQESHDSARAYWEKYLREEVPQLEAKFAERIKESKTQLAAVEDETKKQEHRAAIDAFEKMRFVMRYNALTMLEGIVRDSGDTTALLGFYQQELEVRQTELAYLEGSAAPAKEIGLKKIEVAKAIEGIAAAQAGLAQFEAAEKSYFEALAIRKALPEEMAERKLDKTLSDLGSMYLHRVGDVAKAREYYTQALAIIEASAAARQKALSADNWTAEMRAKATPEEIAKHDANLAQNRDMTVAIDALSQGTMLNNLGSTAQEAGDFKTAAGFFESARKVADALPAGGALNIFELARAQLRARTLSELAALHADTGELDQSLKELDEAIQIKRALGEDRSTAQLLQQAAGLSFEKGDLETARRRVEQARKIFVGARRLPSVVTATSFLAVLARDAGQIEDAARFSEEALTLARKTGNFATVAGAARISASIRLKENKPAEARVLLEEAQAADARTGSVVDRISTLGLFGEVLEAEGNNDKALANYKEAVALLEPMRATAASESAFGDVKRNFRPYERVVRLLIKMRRTDEAFDYLNRAKSKKLKDSLKLSSARTGDKAMQELLDLASGLERKRETVTAQLQSEQARPETERDHAKIENLKLVVASTQGEFRRVVEKIKSANPNWEKFMTVNPKALKETQRSIPPGVIFIQYAPLGEQLYVFLVTKENLKIYTPEVKPEDLWKKVKAVRRQITSGETGAPLAKNLTALYDMLIAPIEPELAAVKTIAFIPNQLLFYLPMQALAKKGADGGLRYLIQDKEIVYLTAADVMKVVQPPDEEKSREGMVAFGNPTGAELPSAELEVNTIAQVFPATEVLSGAQVTKLAVTTEQRLNKRVVHFATHGILNAAAPDQSYIQLATHATPENARLTVGEVWDLPFKRVDIVTLSACETALGDKEPDGGEITTLAEAFSSAGATTVLASLWSVGDESTKEFMVHFYRQLAAGGSKAAALQSAQIALMIQPKYSRPLYWAPFVLMGDWR
jgi:CHAT domain-containing protein